MKMCFRWYGKEDSVSLEEIKQIPNVKGIVSAIYDIPNGEIWPLDRIMSLKDMVEQHGMKLEVIESVPVHEEIKLGSSNRDTYIYNYKQTLKHLSQANIKTVCYNSYACL